MNLLKKSKTNQLEGLIGSEDYFATFTGKAVEDYRSPRRFALIGGQRNRASVLECARPLALLVAMIQPVLLRSLFNLKRKNNPTVGSIASEGQFVIFTGKAVEDYRSPRRFALIGGQRNRASVLECARPLALLVAMIQPVLLRSLFNLKRKNNFPFFS